MPLLERDRQLERLEILLEQARMGRGRLVFLGGEAGAGKTALIRHLAEAVEQRSTVLVGSCDRLSTARRSGQSWTSPMPSAESWLAYSTMSLVRGVSPDRSSPC